MKKSQRCPFSISILAVIHYRVLPKKLKYKINAVV